MKNNDLKFNHLDFIKEKIDKALKNDYNLTLYKVMEELEKYITSDDIKIYLDNLIMNNKKLPNNPRSKEASKNSNSGKIYEEIILYALIEAFKNEKRQDLIVESKSKKINENFIIKTSQNINLLKKLDVDILIWSESVQNKFYALSVKTITRERVAQSQLVLFLLDKDVMKIKYNAKENLFYSPLWKNDTNVKYGIVVWDNGINKDYSKKNKNFKDKKFSTREFDTELFYQDKKVGGGFTVTNSDEHFDGIWSFRILVSQIINFFKLNT